jgi:hypothetical protein
MEAAFTSRLAEFADGGCDEDPLPAASDLTNDNTEMRRPPASEFAPLPENEASDLVVKSPRRKRARQHVPFAELAPRQENGRPPEPTAASEERVNNAVLWHVGRERPVFSGVIRQWLSGGSTGKLRCASAFSWQPQ